jgi:Zn-dependent protease
MHLPKINIALVIIINLQIVAALIGAILHEIAHGYAALKLGDTTARDAGRLSINPLVHIDLFTTILLPAIMIFAGMPALIMFKPVPINMNNLRNPRRDSRIVSLAGPFTNYAIVILAAVIFQIFFKDSRSLLLILFMFYVIIINLFLGTFNLIPIPPLDGSWVLQSFLPQRALINYIKLRTWFVIIFLILLFTRLFNYILNPVYNFLVTISLWLMHYPALLIKYLNQ